jgi:hypothetical protein
MPAFVIIGLPSSAQIMGVSVGWQVYDLTRVQKEVARFIVVTD